MKKTTYKYSQKGFSPIILIIIVIVLLVGAGFYIAKGNKLTSINSQVSQNNLPSVTPSSAPTPTDGLVKYETDKYVLFYPKSLSKGERILGGYYTSFKDPNDFKSTQWVSVGYISRGTDLPYKGELGMDVIHTDAHCQLLKPVTQGILKTLTDAHFQDYKTYKGCLNTYQNADGQTIIYYLMLQKPVTDPKSLVLEVAGVYSPTTDLSLVKDIKKSVTYSYIK